MIDMRKERLSMEEAMNPTQEEAIKYLKSMVFQQDMSPSTLRASAVNKMAIKALESQQCGCEYCNPEVCEGNPIYHRHADDYVGNGKFSSAGTAAHFCPMCGRKLRT